jgi:hypothetical protein
LHAGLNDVVNHRLDDCFAIHLKTPFASLWFRIAHREFNWKPNFSAVS